VKEPAKPKAKKEKGKPKLPTAKMPKAGNAVKPATVS
jgi:hypothetical protein